MSQEISLSLEETNKLRISIGLAPIPVENGAESTELQPSETSAPSSTSEISIEDTNKLRKSLGLPPIPTSTAEKSNRIEKEIENFQKVQSRKDANERENSLKRRLELSKENHNRSKLSKVDLIYDEPMDTDEWLSNLGTSKSAKSAIRKVIVKELDTPRTKIGHDLQQLSHLQNDAILTLQDTDILQDDQEDELQNDQLSNKAKLQKDLLEKAKADSIKFNGRGYNNATEEAESEISNKDVVLTGTITLPDQAKEEPKVPGRIDLEDIFSEISTTVASDYSAPKMKKIKKKSKSSRKPVKEEDEDIILTKQPLEKFDDNVEDEQDELQNVLSMKRRMKQNQSRKHLTGEEIANEIKLYKRWDMTNDLEAESYVKSGLVVDDTSDFLNSLKGKEDDVSKEDNNGETEVNGSKANAEMNTEENIEENVIMNGSKGTDALNHTIVKETNNVTTKSEDLVEPSQTQDSKSNFTNLSLTLAYLQSQNIIEKTSEEQRESNRVRQLAAKEAELFKISIEIEERRLKEELQTDKDYMNKPKVERGAIFEQMLEKRLIEKNIINSQPDKGWRGKNRGYKSRDSTNRSGSGTNGNTKSALSGYNPEVKLNYHDEQGNSLNTKQAFKYLSHQFHGNSSKYKPEKKVEKSTNERIV